MCHLTLSLIKFDLFRYDTIIIYLNVTHLKQYSSLDFLIFFNNAYFDHPLLVKDFKIISYNVIILFFSNDIRYTIKIKLQNNIPHINKFSYK